MRQCSMCLADRPLTAFGKHRDGKDGLRSRCKDCNRIEARESYKRNPEPYKRRARAFRRTNSAAVVEWLRELKVRYGCLCCGENDLCTLDFHHLADKDMAVTSAASKGVLFVESELAKCVVLCANCHRKVHAGRITLSTMARTVREKFRRSAEARVTYRPVVVRRKRKSELDV